MEKITGEDLAALLFEIHRHSGRAIIYHEKDLLPILKAIGLPEPKWGNSMTVKQWKAKQKKEKR